ncbi:MAG: hypothetical protein RLZZ86_696, partial [Cyanobacteriota bacterium]
IIFPLTVRDVNFHSQQVTILTRLLLILKVITFESDNYNNNYDSKDSL